MSSCRFLSSHDLVGDLLTALIAGLARFLREVVETLALQCR